MFRSDVVLACCLATKARMAQSISSILKCQSCLSFEFVTTTGLPISSAFEALTSEKYSANLSAMLWLSRNPATCEIFRHFEPPDFLFQVFQKLLKSFLKKLSNNSSSIKQKDFFKRSPLLCNADYHRGSKMNQYRIFIMNSFISNVP